MLYITLGLTLFFFKQKTAYEMRISDWSSDVCSSDLSDGCPPQKEESSIDMQTITVTGGVGRDAELRSTQRGDQVCSFNVGVNQGYGDKKSTNWYRVSLWGKRGESLQPYLLKGVKVAIRSEEHTSELQSLMRISYAVFCLKKKNTKS